ncbi:hypothetical protein GCM10018781_48110 [Kitasatospora indigofera]|uniref:Uncharacterized protein n=1 Tax=Kitasatospora indigofera TaxID=67307 RepID=A0A919KYB2_9ACTN|nr:hypothetical protein GCM10018781_48110 [Kitasatospora indigofera]
MSVAPGRARATAAARSRPIVNVNNLLVKPPRDILRIPSSARPNGDLGPLDEVSVSVNTHVTPGRSGMAATPTAGSRGPARPPPDGPGSPLPAGPPNPSARGSPAPAPPAPDPHRGRADDGRPLEELCGKY